MELLAGSRARPRVPVGGQGQRGRVPTGPMRRLSARRLFGLCRLVELFERGCRLVGAGAAFAAGDAGADGGLGDGVRD
jgi:hypothetical protein